jgi:hypothetical protein
MTVALALGALQAAGGAMTGGGDVSIVSDERDGMLRVT